MKRTALLLSFLYLISLSHSAFALIIRATYELEDNFKNLNLDQIEGTKKTSWFVKDKDSYIQHKIVYRPYKYDTTPSSVTCDWTLVFDPLGGEHFFRDYEISKRNWTCPKGGKRCPNKREYYKVRCIGSFSDNTMHFKINVDHDDI